MDSVALLIRASIRGAGGVAMVIAALTRFAASADAPFERVQSCRLQCHQDLVYKDAKRVTLTWLMSALRSNMITRK